MRKGFYFDDDPNKGGVTDPPKPDPKQDLKKGDDKTPEPIPYDRFKEVNEAKLEAEKQLQALKDAQETAEKKKLEDDKKWEDLYKSELEKSKQKDAEVLRLKVAQKKGLPADLYDRLRGETEQELEADADKLLEFLKEPTGPGIPPKKPGGAPKVLDYKSMSSKEIIEHAGDLLKQGLQ